MCRIEGLKFLYYQLPNYAYRSWRRRITPELFTNNPKDNDMGMFFSLLFSSSHGSVYQEAQTLQV